MNRKYMATGPEAEFQSGSRGRVLRNRLGITRVRDMNEAESQALLIAGLMGELKRSALVRHMPCRPGRDNPIAGARPPCIHRRHSGGDGPRLWAADGDVWPRHRAFAPTRCFQCSMKASVLAGDADCAPLTNGARMPSTADDVRADTRSAASRTAADFRCGLDCLSVMPAMVLR